MKARLLLLSLSLGVLACGTEDPPTDCGDSSMSIVTLVGDGSGEDKEIRTCIDIHAASRADAAETTPGRDESFATSQPNAIPWTDITYPDAIAACGRAGKVLCDKDELRAIVPSSGITNAGVAYDETTISALSPTSAVTEVPHRYDALNPVDMVARGETGKPPFPEGSGSVAYWTVSPVREDKYHDPKVPLLLGRLQGDTVAGGVLLTTPVTDGAFKHPLVGFRCCVNARMRAAFGALPHDPKRVLEEEPNVPIEAP